MVDNIEVFSKSRILFFILAVFVIFVAIFISTDYANQPIQSLMNLFHTSYGEIGGSKGIRRFTKDELSKYTGENGQNVYLSFLGKVYDVTKGSKHYGPGGGYQFFAGKDATRAFVTGDFTEAGLVEDITGLSSKDILGLEDWKKFYNKDYTYIGKLIGHYYSEDGSATSALLEYFHEVQEALKSKQSEDDDRQRFPPCNFEYKEGYGRRIWCSKLSGGVKRDWVGLPRQYFMTGSSEPRCACVKDYGAPSGEQESEEGPDRGDLDNPSMKLYENCDPKSFQCYFKD